MVSGEQRKVKGETKERKDITKERERKIDAKKLKLKRTKNIITVKDGEMLRKYKNNIGTKKKRRREEGSDYR